MKVFIHSNLNMLRYDALWQRMLTEHEQDYPNVIMLVELILILPMSTACCERGFSAMKRVKNDWRSSLSSTSLNSILRIVIDGPSVMISVQTLLSGRGGNLLSDLVAQIFVDFNYLLLCINFVDCNCLLLCI